MTDTEKDARIAESQERIAESQERVAALEERIENIAAALTLAPDSSYWSSKLSEMLGTRAPVDNMHTRLRQEYDRGRHGAISHMIAVLNGMNGGAK